MICLTVEIRDQANTESWHRVTNKRIEDGAFHVSGINDDGSEKLQGAIYLTATIVRIEPGGCRCCREEKA